MLQHLEGGDTAKDISAVVLLMPRYEVYVLDWRLILAFPVVCAAVEKLGSVFSRKPCLSMAGLAILFSLVYEPN